jgi:Fe-S cluster assembly protein SufD
MSETQPFEALFDAAILAAQERSEPEWRIVQRKDAFAQFLEQGLPTPRHEDWKYTNLKSLADAEFSLPPAGTVDESSLLSDADADEIRVTFVNGSPCPDQALAAVGEGVEIRTFQDAMNNGVGSEFRKLLDRERIGDSTALACLNRAIGHEGVWIRVGDNVKLDKRIHILFLTTGSVENVFVAPRVLVSVGRSSEARILQSHIGSPGSASFTCAVSDLHVSDNAHVRFNKVQSEATEAFHYGFLRTHQCADSHLTLFEFSRGARLARSDLYAGLAGEGAQIELNGLYAVRDKQHVDHHTAVDHLVPRCISRQTYKGILAESAHAVFNGRIIVRPHAVQTDGFQMNQNLLLSRSAKVDTKPQLEIQNDDVKCTHGATIGQIDDDQRFYLMSRGIEKDEATKMLSRGFAEDVLYSLHDKRLQASLHVLLDGFFST